MNVVLAFSRRPDASLRDIVRTGAVDLLQLPVDGRELVDAVQRAAELASRRRRRRRRRSRPRSRSPPDASVEDGGVGRVFTISSATGGCGKTFFATNLAYFLVRYTGKRACIVDLDLQFGEVSTALRLRPKFTIFDALQREDTDEDDMRAHIEEYTVGHETGVYVLAAPREPSEADRIAPPDVTRIVEAVRKQFDYVDRRHAAAAQRERARRLRPVRPPVRDGHPRPAERAEHERVPQHARPAQGAGRQRQADPEQGRVRRRHRHRPGDRLFPQGFDAVLPYAKEVSRSINLGMPVMAASPQSEISRLMTAGMKPLLPAEHQSKVTTDTEPQKKGLFRRRR